MRIQWTPSAVRDLNHICDYIQEHDTPAAARKVARTLHEAINSLAQLPSRGRLGRLNKTREFVFTNLPYIAVYRISEEDIHIIRILHTAQNWPD